MWGSCLCCMLLLLLLLLHSFLYMFGGSVVRCAHRACMSTRSRARSETTYLRLYVCMLVCPVQVVLAHSIICHYEYSDPHCAAYHCPWFVIKRSHFDSCFILPFFFVIYFFFLRSCSLLDERGCCQRWATMQQWNGIRVLFVCRTYVVNGAWLYAFGSFVFFFIRLGVRIVAQTHTNTQTIAQWKQQERHWCQCVIRREKFSLHKLACVWLCGCVKRYA